MSTAGYQREWRAKRGARTGRPGRPATQPCGTPAGHKRHKYNGEDPCGPCAAAEAERQHQLYLARKARAK